MLLLIVSNGRVALENVIKYGILISPLKWLQFMLVEASLWNWPNLTMVLFSNITIILVFVVEKILEKGILSNYFAAVFYPILVCAHLVIPAVVTLILKGNPLCSVFSLSIIVIEALKIVSYVHMSSVEMASLYPASLNLCDLYYFMLAPTLCYELKFPRSVRRRKLFLAKRFIEMVFLSFLMAALVQQWVVPTVHNSMRPLSEMEVGRCVERLLKLAIPNIIIWLIGFYTIFHATLNFAAEVLKFADREFYRDFWNSETIQYFWRTWNIPVSVPLHMFRLWACYGMLAQIPLSLFTDYVVRGGRAGEYFQTFLLYSFL
ncbi:unnamed protein product [Nippostrongylus brasiliensis]|uniref:diacylglycerol O-acyltransferase n=1 Tax=Nippostrongylus brasiliensis TaxID=27835 RepID=A0A0N4YUF5_NIPBR|nr:unnamed protein product [Nippostrongylus brasiliensis]